MITSLRHRQIATRRPNQRAVGNAFQRFGAARGGNVAITFAFTMPVLLFLMSLAVDYGMALGNRRMLQEAADAASLAGAKELSLADANRVNVAAVVDAVVAAYVKTNIKAGAPPVKVQSSVIDVPSLPQQVKVEIAQTMPLAFKQTSIKLNVTAVASIIGKPNLCLLALDPSNMGTIYIQKSAAVVGQNCSIFSNSSHSNGIKAFGSSKLSGSVICSAGGFSGGKANYSPTPIPDCPQFPDPLVGRPEPNAAGCSETNLVLTNKTTSLSPGTYCGGLTINGSSNITLKPGIYIMKDGPLSVEGTSKFIGLNTGFYFTGPNARLFLDRLTTIDLTAPKDGMMAGILFFGSRSQSDVQHDILSDNARNVLGTIYFPSGTLSIDANQPIADKSAYTAIIVGKMTANSGPTVYLNTDYSASDVPVPDGIRGAGQPARLVK